MDLTAKSQEELDGAEEIKNLKKVEAALFISARYLTVQELVELTDINPLLLREILLRLGLQDEQRHQARESLRHSLAFCLCSF